MTNYKIEESIYIDEKKGTANIYTHNSGFKVIHIKNSDKNKVFIAGFKTLPENDMGVAHALEHCVLSKSNIYKNINIFDELSKKTTYNYLNALTYYDKTAYVASSKIESHFRQQFVSYLDGVLEPILEEELFKQEVLNKQEENNRIKYNGVMLNEMEDYFSNINNRINNEIYKRVYTNNYKYCNFGDPNKIKNINYVDITNYYNENYNIKNCFLYLYGDMDIEFYLKFIDEHYSYKAYENTKQNLLERNNFVVQKSKIYIDDIDKPHLSLAYNVKIDEKYSIEMVKVFVDYIYNEYLKKHFGHLSYTFDLDMKEPVLIFTFKNCKKLKFENLKELFTKTIIEIKESFALEGYKSQLTKAKYNYDVENYGYKPKGVFYGLQLLKDFVHNDEINIDGIKFNDKINDEVEMEYVVDVFNHLFLENKQVSCFSILKNNLLAIKQNTFKESDFDYSYYTSNILQEDRFYFINLQTYGIMCSDIQLKISRINEDLFIKNFYIFLISKKIKERFLNIIKLDTNIINNTIVFKFKCYEQNFNDISSALYYFFSELILEQLDIINYINEYKIHFKQLIKNDDNIKYNLFFYAEQLQNTYNTEVDEKTILKNVLKIHEKCTKYFDYKCNFGFNFEDTNTNVKSIKSVLDEHKRIKIKDKPNVFKKKALDNAVIMKTNVNSNYYLLNVKNRKFDYTHIKVISILLKKEVLHQKLRLENGVYDFGINVVGNNIVLYTKCDPNIKETYNVYENCFNYLLQIDELNKKIENAKLQLFFEESNDFNSEWYFDRMSKKIFDNFPLIEKSTLNDLDVIKYVKENLLNLKGYKLTIGNQNSITNNEEIFDNIIKL